MPRGPMGLFQFVDDFLFPTFLLNIKQSRSPHDLYKQVLGLKFDNPQVHLVQNDDFVDPMATLGGVIHSRIQQFVLE